MSVALVWFRRDLRVSDHPALQQALADGHVPLPVYFAEPDEGPWPMGAASRWWLHHSLASLRTSLQASGSDLLILQGDALGMLRKLAALTGSRHLYWNRCYEPLLIERDQRIKQTLQEEGIEVSSHNGSLLWEPWQLLKQDGTPYRVFTPFWKALLKKGSCRPVLPVPDKLPPVPKETNTLSVPLEALELLPGIPWDAAFPDHWSPGEDGAASALQQFLDDAVLAYDEDRNRPAITGTSRLSPHLHFGEISPWQVWERSQQWSDRTATSGAVAAVECFLRELVWREFGQHLLFHFPHTADEPLDKRFAAFPWRDNATDLARWQQGQTGIPIVDAGMRELWHTGWMHNRVRMIVASLLTKNLQLPWLAGARWFWETLVDADLANNTLGWQWTAGCGADAAPYFRVFNPVLQGERFDGDGSYVRRWVPELEKIPVKFVHQPWAASEAILQEAGIALGRDYPLPIVDLKESRRQALTVWDRIKQLPRDP